MGLRANLRYRILRKEIVTHTKIVIQGREREVEVIVTLCYYFLRYAMLMRGLPGVAGFLADVFFKEILVSHHVII